MKKLLALLTTTLLAPTLHALDLSVDSPATVSANCYYVGAQSLSTGAISSGSAVVSDKSLAATQGIITLKIRPGKQDPSITVWTATQTINIGFNYSVVLNLNFQNGQRFGDKVFEGGTLRTNAILKYKKQAVSGASLRTNTIESEYNDGTGEKFYETNFTLDNVLLRAKLGLLDQLDGDLTYQLRDSAQKKSLFSSLGDGNGAVTSATVHCKIPINQ